MAMTKWTDQEIKILKTEYQKNDANIPELKTRTESAIHCKAHKLGLKSYTRSFNAKKMDR